MGFRLKKYDNRVWVLFVSPLKVMHDKILPEKLILFEVSLDISWGMGRRVTLLNDLWSVG